MTVINANSTTTEALVIKLLESNNLYNSILQLTSEEWALIDDVAFLILAQQDPVRMSYYAKSKHASAKLGILFLKEGLFDGLDYDLPSSDLSIDDFIPFIGNEPFRYALLNKCPYALKMLTEPYRTEENIILTTKTLIKEQGELSILEYSFPHLQTKQARVLCSWRELHWGSYEGTLQLKDEEWDSEVVDWLLSKGDWRERGHKDLALAPDAFKQNVIIPQLYSTHPDALLDLALITPTEEVIDNLLNKYLNTENKRVHMFGLFDSHEIYKKYMQPIASQRLIDKWYKKGFFCILMMRDMFEHQMIVNPIKLFAQAVERNSQQAAAKILRAQFKNDFLHEQFAKNRDLLNSKAARHFIKEFKLGIQEFICPCCDKPLPQSLVNEIKKSGER